MIGVARAIISGARDGFRPIVTARQGETLSLRYLFDDSKGRMMKNKIWGLMIILSCFLVPASFAEETQFNLSAPDFPTLEKTWVEVGIEKNGQLVFQALGSTLQGKVSIKVIEKVTILSGDYTGWGYAYSKYKIGNQKGVVYFVFHHNEWQGMLSGDVVGVAQQSNGSEGNMTWRVAKADTESFQETVSLAFHSYTPGKQTTIQDVWMPVIHSFRLSTNIDSTGHYTGPYQQETTILLLPAPDGKLRQAKQFKGGGLEFGTYEAGMEDGTIWSFIDNTETVDPFNKKRYGTRDGELAGTSEISFNKDADGNTKILGNSIHVAPY